ncbi:uncharacterized protein LACBIDRAFT_328410 [Laccaria bicolor S238N-H82]|uniref:Predicted protein n=1 Tax=Laccaria bicolor (strain S238N-H82 / ATCC MYA-4686) TaxID=486041 RepID=B0DES8_LACBS|nr:uncharacterized protein LACBIDRAFT_328410 [Laccaria bicolor S238N-H82]EDR07081.1 predicted protein [Laccaria bicolor S238N-H82]|eukprot:XP_001882454.1 predicted protein [Laccaria bicolor S238N-H82]
MSNTARFNRGRNADGSRPSKRRRTGVYHDRLLLNDDLDIINSRETQFNTSHRLVSETPRTTQMGEMMWVADDNEFGLDPGSEWYEEAMEGDVMVDGGLPEVQKKKKKARSRLSIVLLAELPHLAPPTIAVLTAAYLTSYAPRVVFDATVVPLHHIEKWSGHYFIKTSLKSLRLRIQLNHMRSTCTNTEPCHQDLRILHTNGIHDVAFDYCGCLRAVPKHIQLLRCGLYPASQKTPKTCASFALLQLLHLLALTTKGSTYDFYRTLEKLTSNTGLSVPTSRYRPLLRMVLQFRHLKMLKRGGVGHDPAGVEGVGEGALGLSCPHCPRPGVNLPDGWDKAPESLRFLYFLTYSMDANFRLKNQLVSSFSSDPGLGIGMAYMVPREGYDSYVLSRASDADISTCVGFQALAKANSKFSRGLRFTGVGAVSCARSEMVLPTCVGNLQKGERYANMDYIFGRAIRDVSPNIPVVVSYDIACQWFVNLRKRMDDHWPMDLLPASPLDMRPQIPAFPEPGHGQRKHQEYSFKLSWGMGLTDGEGCERIWAANNALGNAMKTQGPGSRQDVINDHLGFWNWLKYCGMGKNFFKIIKFTADSIVQELAAEWMKLCKDWDRATYPKQAENPFITHGLCLTEAEIQKEFAAEEESLLVGSAPALHSTTMSSFMVLALDLEDSQRRLWVYMPGLQQLQLEQERTNSKTLRAGHFQPPPASNHPEHVDLWLPSSLSSTSCVSVCSARLIAIEEKLRMAQCSDALESLRHVLCVKSRMILFKNKNVRGQRDGTQSRSVIDRVHARARAAATKYRLARLAKLSLSGPGAWESALRVLLDSDIRAYSDPEKMRVPVRQRGTLEHKSEEVEESGPSNTQAREIDLRPEIRGRRDGTGDTHCTLSWIWQMDGFAVSGEDVEDDILRSEWAKSRARANRAEEEVLLVREEMRRTLEFLNWKARWWEERGKLRTPSDKDCLEGLQAYSMEQAALHKQLHTSFKEIWRQPLEDAEDEEGEVVDDERGGGIDGDDDEDAKDDSEEGDDEEDGDDPDDDDDD